VRPARLALLIAFTFVLVGAAAGPAIGAVFCVPAASASCAGTDEATVTTAINASNASTDHDVIRIAAKATSYVEDFPQVNAGRPVDIVGAGPTETVLRPLTQGNSRTTLQISDPNSTISNLGIALAHGSGTTPGDQETGLWLAGAGAPGTSAANVAITAPDPVTNSTGALLNPLTRFSSGTVTLPLLGSANANAGAQNAGTVEDSRVTADTGVISRSGGLVRRTRVDADFHGLDVAESTTRVEEVTVVLSGSVPNAIGLAGVPISAPGNGTARHVTLVGTGDASSTGASCADFAGLASCSLTLDGVVIRGFGKDLKRTAAGASSNISIDYSDYDPAKVTSTNSGSGTGAITPGPHNVNVDPGFVSSDPANPAAFHLLATSPLIDAGNPSLPSDESTTDEDGASRVTAGRNTAPSVSDIGAFEFQPHVPTAVATGPASGKIGQSLTFRASGSADPDPGDALTYFWGFDDGGIAIGPTVNHAFGSLGSHTATVTVTDLSHRTATATATVTIGPRILSLTKKADRKTVRPRAQVGFTISATNGEDAALTLRSLSDRLPAGFKYVRGSATLGGKLVTDPRIAGRKLTWTSPVRRVKKKHGHRTLGARIALTVPAHRTLRLHLLTIAAKTPGKYTNRASGDGGPAVAVSTQAAGATVRVKAH
jgi:uncharacterized repeat protein (TIGR01451 family)